MSRDEYAEFVRKRKAEPLRNWTATLLVLVAGVLLGSLAQFVTGGLWWLGMLPLFFAVLRHQNKHAVGSHQFSLRGVLLTTAVVGIWLALFVSRIGGELRWFVILSPYFFALYLAHRFITGRFALAAIYLFIHTVAFAITAVLILRATDGVDRWMLSLPIVFIDLPISFPLAFFKPPGYLGPLYVLLVGSFFGPQWVGTQLVNSVPRLRKRGHSGKEVRTALATESLSCVNIEWDVPMKCLPLSSHDDDS